MTRDGAGVPLVVPPGWELVQPAAVGAPGLALLAVREGVTTSGFTPTTSVALHDGVVAGEVAVIGSETVRRLDAREHDVRIRRREAIGSGRTEGLAQELRLTTWIDGRPVEVAQLLLVLVLAGPETGRLVAWAVTASAAVQDLDEVLPDVEAFVAGLGVRPALPAD
jgi:hypothetical protein